MTADIRWLLLVVAGVGVVLNVAMLHRLNRDVRDARALALLDAERALALRHRRWQSAALLVIASSLTASAFVEAGSGLARLMVLIAAFTVDWKSWRLFGDRLKADVMVAERLRRDSERDGDAA
jgi:hypothetical protein